MRRSVSFVAVLFMLVPLAVLGQRSGRHSTSSSTGGATTAPPEDPDVLTFEHAIAVEATEQQIGQFRLMVKTTQTARQLAHDFQRLESNAGDSDGLSSKATGLQKSAEEARSENRNFRRSLSDAQEAGLKNLTKQLTKSDLAVSKSEKAISQQLDQTTLNSRHLITDAANMEKALAVFLADQLNLGKGMGIPSH